jgi:ATP-binding cassette subfamily G (WHITE) protein 2 (PDR)
MKRLSVVYKNLNVFGSGKALQLQKTVGDIVMAPFRASEYFGKSERKQILHSFDGIIRSGELCVVLGRPGSGCSTLLKALTGELHGLDTDDSTIHYNGIPQNKMIKEFKGETVYNQEVDKHFPHLTVGQTLEHAAALRTPSNRPMGVSRQEFSGFLTRVVMAVLGLSHTYNTKVGNDFVRGVSGGERKRVSVAEMMLAGAPFASWDNSTRGLDSATALKFVKVSPHIKSVLFNYRTSLCVFRGFCTLRLESAEDPEVYSFQLVVHGGDQIDEIRRGHDMLSRHVPTQHPPRQC